MKDVSTHRGQGQEYARCKSVVEIVHYDSDWSEGGIEGDLTVDGEKYEEAELSAAGVMQWLTGQQHREVTGVV